MDTTTSVVLVAGIALVAKVVWELYLSPLARQQIPGPKWAAVSDFWQYWWQFRKRRTLEFHAIFERYGPVVRLGPNRVAVRDADAVKSVYTTHRFRKSSWYSMLEFGGVQNMASTRDPAFHSRSRRLSAPAFRGENLRAAGHLLLKEMDVLVARLQRDCADGGYVDVIQLFPQLTIDVLGLTVLGVHFNQTATGQVPEFGKYLQSWLIDKLLVSPLPHVVTSVLRKLPIPQLQNIVTADERLTGYIKDLYENGDEKSPEGRWSMLETYRSYRDAETGDPAPLELVVSDLCLMFLAGIETTAISFTYVTYILAAHEEMWKIMRAEVASADLQAEDLVDTLRKLPYLNAFLREILRAHGPGSIFLERVVPAGGATLDGYFLPEGTEVGAQSYSLHLDERIFPQPHVVDPLRWVRLDETTGQYVNREDITPAMNANYFPFSLGVRSCVGKPLAELELALVTVTLIKNFRIHLHEKTTPESMRPIDFGGVRPRSSTCLLRFEHAPTTAV